MATELYDITVPAFLRGFAAMSAFLTKAERWVKDNGVDPSELLAARLYEDMGPLTAQVQRASDSAKLAVVRLGEVENVAMPDDETSFADLQARIAKTVDLLKSVAPDAIDGREDKAITLPTPNRTLEFTGRSYVLQFVLPNFYFHITTAYAILRMKGVPVGKLDYLGAA
ncbi:hypothetical protein ASG11_14235 [Sphingomonas sp. Leaf357]|uniref:DUF1993 domain-containing protein n=1 Tax=Sphingomonas sp. Leaf357 TaxID=1736350 RepID=UPI0006F3E448|nr:DUF1993 domain-containing protein [Sphingomonas sp. Leaf357]KQS01969.1 hypothetical protein ASG11_14235 [Sphingomonas sp. Leaf357]